MGDHEMNKPTQTSSNTTKTRDINTHYSYYDWHYNQPFYVDKTLLIPHLLYDYHILISAPPRLGKTLNMDMARRFFEMEVDENGKAIELDEDKYCLKEVETKSKNFKLFKGKKIFEYKPFVSRYFGKYPTIHVDFSELVGYDFDEIMVKSRKILHKAFRQHAYLEKSSFWDRDPEDKKIFMEYFDPMQCASLDAHRVKWGLFFLSKFLHGHHGKAVYVFIDEVDAPTNALIYQNMMPCEDMWYTVLTLQIMMSNLLEDNKFVERSLTNASQLTGKLMFKFVKKVRRCSFMENHEFRKFYGFEEEEVKYLLKKAGQLEDFNKIEEKCNGYNTESLNGMSYTKIYNTWAVMNYLKTGNFDVYWSASLLRKMKELVGHAKFRSNIARIMSNHENMYIYTELLDVPQIETLSKFFCNGEISEDACDIRLFFQFLTAQGFFHPIRGRNRFLELTVPNRTAYSVFDEILRSVDSINKYYNHSPELIKKFTESLENLARSRNEDAVYALAENIDALCRNGKIFLDFNTKYELQSVLDAYMLQKFRHVSVECKTSLHTKCDTVLVIADLHVMFIINYKASYLGDFENVRQRILDKGYDTLAEELSLKEVFPKYTSTVKNRIYLEICIQSYGKEQTSITYSFNNMERNTVTTKGIQN
ncbi:hypothetical protein PV326_011639 [Microctonus aethiopoides]|nr:hypothetical protein PV326_011639 [Microctonus aethiopoides]